MDKPHSILVLFAHPALEKSRLNRQLIAAVNNIPGITIHDLYETYPQFHINVGYEQELLRNHDIIVFQHPFYWYSSPAILKEWQDLVLEHGFAYGHEGTALVGKKFLSALTTGGGKEAYQPSGHNRFPLRSFLIPFEQTARLCGMDYLPPFVIHGTHQIRDLAVINDHAQSYRRTLLALRDNQINWETLSRLTRFNDALDDVIIQSTPEASNA
jgi:glutathione-regulated potassium-efflux system ancillary protein KefG